MQCGRLTIVVSAGWQQTRTMWVVIWYPKQVALVLQWALWNVSELPSIHSWVCTCYGCSHRLPFHYCFGKLEQVERLHQCLLCSLQAPLYPQQSLLILMDLPQINCLLDPAPERSPRKSLNSKTTISQFKSVWAWDKFYRHCLINGTCYFFLSGKMTFIQEYLMPFSKTNAITLFKVMISEVTIMMSHAAILAYNSVYVAKDSDNLMAGWSIR